MPKNKKIPRSEKDILTSLIKHVSLLRDYAERAFDKNDSEYLGEVAGKLRILVVKTRTNVPLLIELMERFDSKVEIKLDKPQGILYVSLKEYMNRNAMGIRTSEGFKKRTTSEFISVWAQQFGAAHEDWKHDEDFMLSKNLGISIGGLDANVQLLRSITNTILSVADSFFQELQSRGILKNRK